MKTLLLKGEINAADYNPQQGFDGNPITWDLTDGGTQEKVDTATALLTKCGVQYGSRDGSDYAYFWFKETPDETYGPGDTIEIYEDGDIVFVKCPEKVVTHKRSTFATWE